VADEHGALELQGIEQPDRILADLLPAVGAPGDDRVGVIAAQVGAMVRNPALLSSWRVSSQPIGVSGKPWMRTTGGPSPESLKRKV
jgi:hypothetical protein